MKDYAVQVRLETRTRDDLTGLPAPTEEVTFEAVDRALIITVHTRQETAHEARNITLNLAHRAALLLSLLHNGYRINGLRFLSVKTPNQKPSDFFSPTASLTDTPDGGVLALHASGWSTQDAAAVLSYGPAWDSIPLRITAALDVFWEAQSAEVRDVKFILLMAVMDILVGDRDREKVLHRDLSEKQRASLRQEVEAACASAGLDQEATNRLIQRFMDTNTTSPWRVRLDYVSGFTSDGFGIEPFVKKTAQAWLEARNKYIHEGARVPASIEVEHAAIIVGGCISNELSTALR